MNSFKIRRTLLAVIAATTACVSLPAFASKEKPVIGFSIDDLRVERWARDRDYFIAAAKDLGAEVLVQSADGDTAKQVAQIENLITKKVDAIVVVPKDGPTLYNVFKEAKKAGIKIISYDRVVLSPEVDLWVTFDNVKVGQMQGEALMQALPKGNVCWLSIPPWKMSWLPKSHFNPARSMPLQRHWMGLSTSIPMAIRSGMTGRIAPSLWVKT